MVNKIKEKLIQQISAAKLPANVAQSLIDSLEYLGDFSYKFLISKIKLDGIVNSGIPVLEIVNLSKRAMKDVMERKLVTVKTLLEDALHNPEYKFGQYLIPLVCDLRQYLKKQPLSDGDSLKVSIDIFEQKLFRVLPKEELHEIVKSDLLHFVRNINVVMEFKQVYWLEELSDDGDWGRLFMYDMEANEELLGKEGIKTDDKVVQPMVKNWIKDYIVSIPKQLSQRGAYDQIQYIQQSKNTQGLTDVDKNTLLDIIKLYSWFAAPSVTEEELDAYEEELRRKEQAAKRFAGQPATVAAPRPVPAAVKPSPISMDDVTIKTETRRREAEAVIERKLDDLRQKSV